MYQTSTEMVKGELPKEVLKPLYKIFENANIAYNDLVNSYQFFNGNFFGNVKGRLLSFLVMKHFDRDYLPANFPFRTHCIKMAFGQERVELERGNILLGIARVNTRYRLPFKSKYKKEHSQGNFGIGKQIKMDFIDNGILFKDKPFYGLIVYKANNEGVDFVDLIIPDSRYETILIPVPLKPKFIVHKIEDIVDDPERILSISNLKNEALNVKSKIGQ